MDRRNFLAASLTSMLVGAHKLGPAHAAGKVKNGSSRSYEITSEKTMIPMPDGAALSANIVKPANANPEEKFPAIIDYDAYRGSEYNWLKSHGIYAEHGYYVISIDVRGTGGSTGFKTPNQYSEQEQLDAVEAIAWLAKQGWCNGNIGMFGTSYGGFTSIQVAKRRPPALKAIIPIFATDNVYTDDVFYYNGALQGEAWGRWVFSMISLSGLPAAPDFNFDNEQAHYRIDQEPWLFDLFRQKTDNDFWKDQSLAPDYDAIEAATFLIGGWLDGYPDSTFRMMEKMKAPIKAMTGPWTHGMNKPGPAIDVRHEYIRWWDYWLKGLDTGIMDEHPLSLYVNQFYKPDLSLINIPGEWRAEEGWPSHRAGSWTLYPQKHEKLSAKRSEDLLLDLEYKPAVGLTNRYRVPHNVAEIPIDQRIDDANSLVFDTDILEEDVEIMGFPKASIYVSATAPVANWIVRLCEVAPDGTSTQVSKGILNGCHYRSHETPERLVPHKIYHLDFNLKSVAWRFSKGNRIRIAVCNADFPNLWPTPYAMSTSLYVNEEHPSHFELPVCVASDLETPDYKTLPDFKPKSGASNNKWTIHQDMMNNTVTLFRETTGNAGGEYKAKTVEQRWFTVNKADPSSAKLIAEGEAQRTKGEDTFTCRSKMIIESDADKFHIHITRTLFLNDKQVRTKSWQDEIKRDFI